MRTNRRAAWRRNLLLAAAGIAGLAIFPDVCVAAVVGSPGTAPGSPDRARPPSLATRPAPVIGGSLTLYLENDVFLGTDREYTHGCSVAWMSPDFSVDAPPPRATGMMFRLLRFIGPDGVRRHRSIAVRQNIYTPEDIEKVKVVEDDVPYAGVLYMPFGVHEKSPRAISSLELDVGIIGPHSYAAQVQKKVHGWLGGKKPAGWANQLHDEIILNLEYDLRRRAYRSSAARGIALDAIPYFGYGLGNMRIYAKVGAQIRVGWHLPNNFGSYNLQPSCECSAAPGPASSPAGQPGPDDVVPGIARRSRSAHVLPAFSFHLYAAAEGEGVAHDIFLDGNTFGKSHSVRRKPWIGRTTVGFGLRIHRVKLDYSFVFKTTTFRAQPTGHRYGGITLTLIY